MSKERRLGRGLEALLGKVAAQSAEAEEPKRSHSAEAPHERDALERRESLRSSLSVVYPQGDDEPVEAPAPKQAAPVEKPVLRAAAPPRMEIGRIEANPHQPRREFDDAEIAQLAGSLARHGLLQPVVVRKHGANFQLVAGERRLRAAMKAGWTDVPVQIIEADDRQMAELALVENLQRKDLNAIEKAISFNNYIEEYGCRHDELAARLEIDRSTVANFIRLLDLPEPVQQHLRRGAIAQGHARALLPLGDADDQIAMCERLINEGWSVRDTEAAVQDFLLGGDLAEGLGIVDQGGDTKPAKPRKSDHLAVMEQEFRSALGAKVTLSANARGKGKIVIAFKNNEEFERLRDYLCGQHDAREAG